MCVQFSILQRYRKIELGNILLNCLICDKKIGLFKFKSQDGFVCKTCYQIVSQNFTQIIRDKTATDLKESYRIRVESKAEIDFEISRRIGQIVLLDDERQKICFPNHRRFTIDNRQPEYHDYSSLRFAYLKEEATGTLATLFVDVNFQNSYTKRIVLIANPISVKSGVYQMMKSQGQAIVTALNKVATESKTSS